MVGWIRQRRLHHCRQELVDPRLADQSIEVIARRWGWPNLNTFSRAFKAAVGISPRTYRQHRAGPSAGDEG